MVDDQSNKRIDDEQANIATVLRRKATSPKKKKKQKLLNYKYLHIYWPITHHF